MSEQKPFGWDVEVEFQNGETKTFHWRGCSETSARRKAILKPLARRVVATRPLSEQDWIRAYGIGRM